MTDPFTEMSSVERANNLLQDLVDYTKMPKDLVKARAKSAEAELAWQWHKRQKENILDFYRDTDLYIFDLTKYQSQLVIDVNTMIDELKSRGIKKMLDLGGGIGEYTIRAIEEAGCDVTFLELKDSETLKYASWRFTKHKVKPNIVTEEHPWHDEPWDIVFAMDVIEHMDEATAQRTLDALRKKARYVFANPEYLKYTELYPQHITKYTMEGFERSGTMIWRNKNL